MRQLIADNFVTCRDLNEKDTLYLIKNHDLAETAWDINGKENCHEIKNMKTKFYNVMPSI